MTMSSISIMDIETVLEPWAYEPVRGHENDAGLDLRTPEDCVLHAHGSLIIDTGVAMAIPEGLYGRLESKSGLNVKYNVVSLGGTIDSGYLGNIVVKLYSMDSVDYQFAAGDKIVQIVLVPYIKANLKYVKKFSQKTERGTDGFGSTGR